MDALSILALAAGAIGIAGSIIPGLPGPPISWVGVLFIYLSKSAEPLAAPTLWIWLAVTVAVTILDYVVPTYFTRISGGSKAASRGALAGLVIGMFLTPVGMILGSLAGAFLAEMLVEGKDMFSSLKSSLGAFAGFLFGTGMKLICSGLMMYLIIRSL